MRRAAEDVEWRIRWPRGTWPVFDRSLRTVAWREAHEVAIADASTGVVRHELFHRHAGPCAVWDAPRGTRLRAPTGIGFDRLALVLEDDEGARLVILSEDFTHRGEWRLPARPPVLGVVVLGAHRIGLFREASSEWLELCALPAPAGDEGLRFG